MKRTIFCIIVSFAILVTAGRSNCYEKLDLMLDWFPNIDHLPIYVASEKKIFQRNGLKVNILSPSDTSDSIKLVATGKVDIAIAYEPQVIAAASRNIPVIVGARLIKHPLSTLLYMENSGIEVPSDLTGKTIGYTVPGMMDLLFKGFARENNIQNYKMVNVGFSIAQSLVSGKVDAVMGPFKNYDTVAMELKGYSPLFFSIEKWGIPDYDELVFITSRERDSNSRKKLKLFASSIEEATELIRKDPQECLECFLNANPGSSVELESRAFSRTVDLYADDLEIDTLKWQKFADFAYESGLTENIVNTKKIISNWSE